MSGVVVIPSRKAENLVRCVESLRKSGWSGEIIAVDDGARAGADGLAVTWVSGRKPFVFARNVNLGIEAAGGRDVLLMNDDTELVTRLGVETLFRAAQDGHWGLLSAAIMGPCGVAEQRMRRPGCWPARTLAFIAVVIPAVTRQAVGLLDEGFDRGYGWEDTDYCLRVRRARMRIGVCGSVVVRHLDGRQTFDRSRARLEEARRIFEAKWGRVAVEPRLW